VLPDSNAGLLGVHFEPVIEADFEAFKAQYLSLANGYPSQGIGAWVFYPWHGFVKVGEAEFDVFCVWHCRQGMVT